MPIGDKWRFEHDGSIVEMVRVEPRYYDWERNGSPSPRERVNILVSVDGVECGYLRYTSAWSAYKLFDGYEAPYGSQNWPCLGYPELHKGNWQSPKGANAKEEFAKLFIGWRRDGSAGSQAEIDAAIADVAETERQREIEQEEKRARWQREDEERKAKARRDAAEAEELRQQTFEGLREILAAHDGTLTNFQHDALCRAIERFSVPIPQPK